MARREPTPPREPGYAPDPKPGQNPGYAEPRPRDRHEAHEPEGEPRPDGSKPRPSGGRDRPR